MLRNAILIGMAFAALPIAVQAHPAPRAEPLPERAHGYLGVEIRVGGFSEVVRIDSVHPNSPAERAGLQIGDMLLALDGRPIRDAVSITDRIASCRPGSRVVISIIRWGNSVELIATVGHLPAETTELRGDRLYWREFVIANGECLILNREEQERQTGVVEGVGEEFLQ